MGWRTALDGNMNIATVFMDLSRAFDSLPHALLIAKLTSDGLSENALSH